MPTSFKLKVKDYNDDGRIVTIAEKELYNLDGVESAADWVRSPIKGIKTFDAPQMTNAITVGSGTGTKLGRIVNNALGYIFTNTNYISTNSQGVGIFSSAFSMGQGCSIIPENFNRVVSFFAARKLIESNWINERDEYIVPNESHPNYNQFVNDAIVFSLFESKSQQSSLRNITYKDKQYNIQNHFFWMPVKEMQDLAIQHNFNDLYNDTIGKTDSYVCNLLKSTNLSQDAQNVLTMAKNLVVKSFPLRQAAYEVKPEMHLNAFDAGWYQIRNGILKDSFPDDYKEFTNAYKAFSARLRPQVYKLGFLKP